MFRKLICLLLALALVAAPLFGGAGTVRGASVSTDEMEALIEKQVRAFADSIDKSNADDAATAALANHGLTGRGKKLSVGKSHALTATLMNSEVIQRTLIATCTQSVEYMQSLGETALYLDLHTGWATFGYYYEIYRNPKKNAEEVILKTSLVKGIPGNAYDNSLTWMAGSIAADMEIKRSTVTADTIIYDVKIRFWDRFDFSTSSGDGFKDLISGFGAVLFREFDWESNISFQIQVPNTCTHSTISYHWVLNAETGIIESDISENYTENKTTKFEHETSNGSKRRYYSLDHTVTLAHDKPWKMEMVVTDPKNILLNATGKSHDFYPSLMLHGRTFFCARQYEKIEVSETSILAHTYCYGTALRPNFSFVQGNPYKLSLENKIFDDGTNMIYLTVYNHAGGVSLPTVALDTFYFTDTLGTVHELRETKSTGVSGMDFKINYFGNGANDYYGHSFEFFANSFDLCIWENGKEGGSGDYFTSKVTKPTCTAQGYTTYTCSCCGYSYKADKVKAKGHSFGDWTVVSAATCTENGEEQRKCKNCDHSETRTVEATGHNYENFVCTNCGDRKYVPGDVDLNETVDVDDVLALLWNVLFPEEYPIEVNADFDGNGTTDVDDVLALLWHVLFPEDYPLN